MPLAHRRTAARTGAGAAASAGAASRADASHSTRTKLCLSCAAMRRADSPCAPNGAPATRSTASATGPLSAAPPATIAPGGDGAAATLERSTDGRARGRRARQRQARRARPGGAQAHRPPSRPVAARTPRGFLTAAGDLPALRLLAQTASAAAPPHGRDDLRLVTVRMAPRRAEMTSGPAWVASSSANLALRASNSSVIASFTAPSA